MSLKPLRFMKNIDWHVSFICSPQTHLRMTKTHNYLHVIVLSKPNAYFSGMRSWPAQNKEMHNMICFCCAQVRPLWKYKPLIWFSRKAYLSRLTRSHSVQTYLWLRGEHCISEVSVWLILVRRNLVIPQGLCCGYYKHRAIITNWALVLIMIAGCLAKLLAHANISCVFW